MTASEEEMLRTTGSGVRGTTIILTSADLRRALGEIEMVRLGKGSA